MSFVVVGSLTFLVGLGCIFGSEAFGIGSLMLSALFGSATAVALPGVGGIQPTHLILCFLAMRALSNPDHRRRIGEVARRPAGAWLLAVWAWTLVCTILMPRLFEGQVLANPIRAEGLIEGAGELPLAPSLGNLTQAVYFSADVVAFLLVASYSKSEHALRTAANIYLAYCAANLIFGTADLVTAKTGTTAALEFMRNASYTIYDELDPSAVDRVKGSFTEASAFAFATIGCFCFAARLALGGIQPKLSGAIAALSLLFIYLSTSSTGYLAALFCILMLYGGAVARLLTREASAQDLGLVTLGPLLALGLVLVIMAVPTLSDSVGALLDATIFDKASSQSGIERASLNATGMQMFFETFGLGGGIGSTRASSFVVAALSNIGLVGTFAFAGFIVEVLLGRPCQAVGDIDCIHSAIRSALIGSLVAAALSGGLVDLGIVFFAIAALASTAPIIARRTTAATRSVGQLNAPTSVLHAGRRRRVGQPLRESSASLNTIGTTIPVILLETRN